MTNLEHVDMHSSRNQVVLGSSVLLGLMVPLYLKSTPGAIKTGETIKITKYSFFCCHFSFKHNYFPRVPKSTQITAHTHEQRFVFAKC